MTVELKDLLQLSPEIVVLITAFIVLVGDAGFGKRGYLNVMAFVGYLLAITALFLIEYGGKAFGMVYRDGLSLIANLIFIFCGMVTSLYARDYLIREDRHHGEYYGLVALGVCSMMFLASSSNLLMFFLSLEILSICLYALSGFTREREVSVEASLKYFIVGAFSSTFTALGIALMLYYVGTIDIDILRGVNVTNPLTFGIAFVLVLVSILFKLASVPFHVWSPDVYQGAPSPSTGFMMTAAKASIFIFALRLLGNVSANFWYPVILLSSVLSMVVGNLSALRQTDVKRILAYSSIAHGGYILIGFLVGKPDAYRAVITYTVAYAIMNLGSFAVISVISGKDEVYTDLESLQGFAVKHPVLASLLALFLFSLTGIPGTVGFTAKFYLFSVALKEGLYWLVIFALLNSAVAAYYYLKIVYYMFMREPKIVDYGVSTGAFTGLVNFALAFLVIQLGLMPGTLVDLVSFLFR